MKNSITMLFFMLTCACNFLNAQERQTEESQDTIYFYFDYEYLDQGWTEKDKYYLKDALEDKGSSEIFFFRIINSRKDLRPKKVLDLKEFVRTSEFYHSERRENRLDDFDLANFLGNYTKFLVDDSVEPKVFFKVHTGTEID